MKRPLTILASILPLLVAAPIFAAWEDGVAAFRDGRYREAAAEFQALISAAPEAPEGHYMLGLSLLHGRQEAEAVKPLVTAVGLNPEQTSYRLTLAQAQHRAGDPTAALATLEAQDPSAVAQPHRQSFGQLLAKVATDADPSEASRKILLRALDADAGSRPLWFALAHLAQRLQRPEEVFEALEKAFELEPGDAGVGRQAVAAAFALTRGRDDAERQRWYRQAAAVAGKVVEVSPSAASWLLAGEALMGAQDYGAARRMFEQAATPSAGAPDAPSTPDPLASFYLASCDLALGEAESALSHLETSLANVSDLELRQQILVAQGKAWRRLERFEAAAEAYRQAGDAEKVAEMVQLGKIREGNREWDTEKARCEAKRRDIEQLREDNDDLEGTAAWRRLIRDTDEALVSCQPYLS